MSRVLLIGLDGADFGLIHPWVREGRLPNLARLMERGVHGELRSTVPPMSPPAWTSFMTGKNPGKHGVFDFSVRRPGSYEVEFVNARHRKSPTMWRLLSDAGKRVCILSVPITYPPEAVNGVMISGMDTPGVGGLADVSAVHPPELHREITEKLGGYLISPNFQAFEPSRCDEIVEAASQTIDRKMATALYLFGRERWDCFMITVGETDGISHLLWKYHDPTSSLADRQVRAYRGADPILRIYQKVDAYVGELCAMADEDTTVIVMSDHGNGPNGSRAVYLNRWLHSRGFLEFRAGERRGVLGAVRRRLLATEGRQLRRAAIRLIPAGWKKRIFRGTNLAGKVESWLRFSHLDWGRTRAYSEETPYFPTLWLNVRGRDPAGTVDPGAEYETLRREIADALSKWVDPETGWPVVRRVHRREDLYPGPYGDRAPDLIIEWSLDGGRSYLFKKSQGPGAAVAPVDGDERAKAKSGDHRDDGIVIASGPSLKVGTHVRGLEIVDLAPTVLFLLGLPIPADMDGSVAVAAFRDGYLTAHLVRYDGAAPSALPSGDAEAAYSAEDEAAVRARLQGLGYIE